MLKKLWVIQNSQKRGYLIWLSQDMEKPWQGKRRGRYSEHRSNGCVSNPAHDFCPRATTSNRTDTAESKCAGAGREWLPASGWGSQDRVLCSEHRIPAAVTHMKHRVSQWPEGSGCGSHMRGAGGGRNRRVQSEEESCVEQSYLFSCSRFQADHEWHSSVSVKETVRRAE